MTTGQKILDFAWFWKVITDGRTTWVKISITTSRVTKNAITCDKNTLKNHWPGRMDHVFSYRVPDLQFDLFSLDVDHSGSELHANGQIVDRLKSLVSELKQEAGFAHTWKI